MRALALPWFLLLSTGCSFIFVRPPPSEPEQLTYFDCVSNVAAPATDITNVAFDGLLVISALDQHETEFATGVAIAGAVYAASAIYGLVMTSQCASAKERLASRVNEIGRNQIIQRAELRVERDAQLKNSAPARPEPGCSRDFDCKGDRICVNASCINPPTAPRPLEQAPVPPAAAQPPAAAFPVPSPVPRPAAP